MKRMDWRDGQVGQRDGQIKGWRDGLEGLIGLMDERDGS
jgi:hypothetical protein